MAVSNSSSARGRLRVLHVVPGDPRGASMVFARRQIDALANAGVECGTFFLRSRTSLGALARERARFRAEEARFDPDIVHAHFGTATGLFCVLATCRPIVVSYRGSDLNPVPGACSIRSSVGRLFSQVAALRARRILCVSRGVRRRLWWGKGRAAVVPSGVDTELFLPRRRAEARTELGWDAWERVVLFNAAGDAAVKRPELARAAVEAARAIAGPIRLEAMDGSVPPERVPILMNAADCLILTSAAEGSPNVVKEAVACGLPVVAVRVGDVEEVLTEPGRGRVVPANAAALGRAIAEAIQAERRTEVPAGLEFSIESATRAIMEEYRRV